MNRITRFVTSLRGDAVAQLDADSYAAERTDIDRIGEGLRGLSDAELTRRAETVRDRVHDGSSIDDFISETFALTGEAAARTLAMRPYEVQMMAGLALHEGRLIEMGTGEGKTLAAVAPAALNALPGRGVHVLTFNDYLAKRDADWMEPVYALLGLSVGYVSEGMPVSERKQAYAADVTYATAKEAGFDHLRDSLARDAANLVHRAFDVAIVDEADSILIDEARVPLVIAGEQTRSGADPYHLAEVIDGLVPARHWETDEHDRNVHLTDAGLEEVERILGCDNLHAEQNALLLAEVNQALHVRTLLHRDVDYIVRDGRIALVDEFTGRVVDDRRWPDGLQSALEAKEMVPIRPGGRILDSITLRGFLSRYRKVAGMTATARPAADEFEELYGLGVAVVPPHEPSRRVDEPDFIFTDRSAKMRALLREIERVHRTGRPILVGTLSVEESERLAELLDARGIGCRVLNARNDALEAEIIAEAGSAGAVTISTNMAGRGTDIRLGGADESDRDRVLSVGGLHVIGTNRHESRRIDDQLRGRAGRQGDPGTSRFFVSLEDPMMIRFGIDTLIPARLRPDKSDEPLTIPAVRREVNRLQRVVEGQNREIRSTLTRYSTVVEKQRERLHAWRRSILVGENRPGILERDAPGRYAELRHAIGADRIVTLERTIMIHFIDEAWADHLEFVADVREAIHLVGIGGLDPLREFNKQVAEAHAGLRKRIEDRTLDKLLSLGSGERGMLDPALQGPSSTWTYLVDDRALTGLQQTLFGHGSSAVSAVAALMTWPLLLIWAAWQRLTSRNSTDT